MSKLICHVSPFTLMQALYEVCDDGTCVCVDAVPSQNFFTAVLEVMKKENESNLELYGAPDLIQPIVAKFQQYNAAQYGLTDFTVKGIIPTEEKEESANEEEQVNE